MLLGTVRSDSQPTDHRITWDGHTIACDCFSFCFGTVDENGHCKHMQKWFASPQATALINELQKGVK